MATGASFLGLCAVLLCGCGGAILRTADGRTYEGDIIGQIDGSYVVKTERGYELVPAINDTDIDHPGNVVGALGLALTFLGAVAAINDGVEAGTFFLLSGLPMAASGLGTWGGSMDRAESDVSGDARFADLRSLDDDLAGDARVPSDAIPDAYDPVLFGERASAASQSSSLDAANEGDNAPSGDDPTDTETVPQQRHDPRDVNTVIESPTDALREAPERRRPAPSDGACWRLPVASTAGGTAWRQSAHRCVLRCQGSAESCTADCVGSELGTDAACASCIAVAARCERYACLADCAAGEASCSACFRGTCLSELARCGGLYTW